MWKSQEIYKKITDLDSDIKKLKKSLSYFSEIKTEISTTKDLLEVLKTEKKLDDLLNKIYTYFMIKKETNPDQFKSIKYKEAEFENLVNIYLSEYIDFERSFLALPKSKQNRYLNTKTLNYFKPRLEQFLRGKTKSSKNSEKLLGMFGSIIDNVPMIYSNIVNKHLYFQDIKFKNNILKIDAKNIKKHESSKNREIRKGAYFSKRKAFNSTSESFTRNLDSLLQYSLISAKSEKKNSVIDYSLESDNLKEKHINSIVSTSLKNKHIVKRYFDILKNELNLKDLFRYDISHDPFHFKIPEKEVFPLIYDAFAYFENNSINIIKNLKNKNHIYIESKPKNFIPYVGYSQSFGSDPYVFCYYQDDLDSAMTLAHECGHAIHQSTLNKHNDNWNSDTSLIIHETASYTHEIIFLLNLLNNSTKSKRKKIIMKLVSYYASVLYGKSFTTKFEKFLYKQKQNYLPLFEKNLSKKYGEIFNEFYSGLINENELTSSEWIGNERLSWQFYELKYVIGFSLASKIAFEIYHGNEEYIEKFNQLMKMGDNILTKDFFELFDVNFNKIDNLVQDAYDQMEGLIEELEEDL